MAKWLEVDPHMSVDENRREALSLGLTGGEIIRSTTDRNRLGIIKRVDDLQDGRLLVRWDDTPGLTEVFLNEIQIRQ